MLNQTGDTGT